jgi:hypothetical protein
LEAERICGLSNEESEEYRTGRNGLEFWSG